MTLGLYLDGNAKTCNTRTLIRGWIKIRASEFSDRDDKIKVVCKKENKG